MAKKTKEIKETINRTPDARSTVWLSTGMTQLDEVFGAGRGRGIESGQCVQIYAPSQAGKTFLINELFFSGIQQFGDKVKIRYAAGEDGNSFDTMSMYGFSMDGRTFRPRTVEDFFMDCKKHCESLKDDEFGIYALDSLDGIISADTQDRVEARQKAYDKGEDFDEGTYGTAKAKLMSSEVMPVLKELATRKNCVIIIIQQIRQNMAKIGGMGPKWVVSGGEAVGFYCDTRVWLSSVFDITVAGRDIGYVIYAEAKKSRGPRGYRKAYVNVFYTTGFDNVGTNIDYLFDFRTDGGAFKKDANAAWKGIPDTADNIKQFMEDNGFMEEFKTLYKAVSPKGIYLKWISENPAAQEKFDEVFGVPMSRDDLILYVEANNLEEELIARCQDKWEQEEQAAVAALSARKPRFQKLGANA